LRKSRFNLIKIPEENTMNTEAKKVSNVVVMKDGREVDFGVRGKLKKEITIDGSVVTTKIDAVNGDSFTFTADMNSHVLAIQLFANGISQKLSDSVVKAGDDPEDIAAAVERTIQQLNDGIWTQRATSEGLVRGFAELYEAIRRVKNYVVGSAEHAALKTSLLGKSEEELKAYKSNKLIKAVLADIAAEKAAARAAKLATSSDESSDADGLEGL
jgi:hypothetical protein